jgi:hypothetical protein
MPRTVEDLEYLPIPARVRPALNRALHDQREWLWYKHKHGLPNGNLTRAQYIAAAAYFGIDVEAMVLDHFKATGFNSGRRRDREVTQEQREKIAFWE